jgi:hypothetical protein
LIVSASIQLYENTKKESLWLEGILEGFGTYDIMGRFKIFHATATSAITPDMATVLRLTGSKRNRIDYQNKFLTLSTAVKAEEVAAEA